MAFQLTLLLCDNMLVSSSTLAAEIFNYAHAAAQAQRDPTKKVHTRWVTPDGQSVKTSAGFELNPTHCISEVAHSDLIHIPALWRNPRPALEKYRAYIPWLQEQHRRNCNFTAVGTGVCFLAEAGLLEDKSATTHWHYFDQLQRQYPRVKLERQRFTTKADTIYCAASVNAMAEIIVYQVERIFGRIIARQAQRNFFHEIRNIAESVSFDDQDRKHTDESIAQAQIWMQDNLGKNLKMPELANQFGMTVRTFNRRFKTALGQTPVDYLSHIRMTFACDLLKNTDLSILEVANFSGFAEATWFSNKFKQWAGVSPKAYRRTVRGKLFN